MSEDIFGNVWGGITRLYDDVSGFFDRSYDMLESGSKYGDYIGPRTAAESGSFLDDVGSFVKTGAEGVKELVGSSSSKAKTGSYADALSKKRYMDQRDAMQFTTSVSPAQFQATPSKYKESEDFVYIERNWLERMRNFAQPAEKVKV